MAVNELASQQRTSNHTKRFQRKELRVSTSPNRKHENLLLNISCSMVRCKIRVASSLAQHSTNASSSTLDLIHPGHSSPQPKHASSRKGNNYGTIFRESQIDWEGSWNAGVSTVSNKSLPLRIPTSIFSSSCLLALI